MIHYEGTLYRPPSEANSLILQATIGCSYNECTFCGMYLGKKFRVRKLEELKKEMKEQEGDPTMKQSRRERGQAIARNRMLDRKRRVRVRRANPDDPQWVEEPARSDALLESAQEARRVQLALDELPTSQRDVLTRSFYAFQSYTEIAGELDVAVGTVKSRARLGFRRLRQLLEEDEE